MARILQPRVSFVSTMDSAPIESIALPLKLPLDVLVPAVHAVAPVGGSLFFYPAGKVTRKIVP